MKFFYTREEEDDSEIFSTPTTLKNSIRSKIGSWLVLMIFGLAMFMPSITNAQDVNLRGVAPVDNPADGFDIDGDLYANFQQPSTETNMYGDWFEHPEFDGAGGWVFEIGPDNLPYAIDPSVSRYRLDLTGTADLDGFVEGSKFNMSPEDWVIEAHTNPGKDDMQNVFIHFDYAANGDLWFFMAGDRKETNGTSYLDFELFQKTVALDGAGGYTSEGTDGGRTVGDLVISIEYSQGGARPQVFVYRWELVETKGGVDQFDYVEYTDFPLNTVYAASNIEGPISVPYGAFGSTTYAQYAFVEAAVNLFEVIEDIDRCKAIATVLIKTKASDALTAALKDVVEPIQIEINPNPTPSVADVSECDGGDATFSTLEVAGETYQWYVSIDDGANYSELPDETEHELILTDITASMDGYLYKVVAKVTLTTCSGEDYGLLTVDDAPDITVTDPDAVCSPDTVDITGAASGCGEGFTLSYWANADGTGEIDPTALGDGTYYIKCTNDSNENCYEIEAVNVTVDDSPDITVTDPDAVCSPNTVDITGAASGCGEGFTLSYWANADGTGEIDPTALGDGTYYIKCTNDSNSNCYEIEAVNVTVGDSPDITITDPDAVCSPNTVDITGAASGCGEGFTLSYWANADGTGEIDPTALGDGTYYIKCTNDSNSNCYEIEAVNVTVDDSPDITVTNPDAVCSPSTVDITGAASGCGEGFTLSYWANADGTGEIDPTALGDGTYYIKCTNDSNSNCYEIEAVNVTVDHAPDITVTNPDAVCSPDTVDITGAASGCGEGFTLSYWANADGTGAINETALGEGTYYIKCTNDSNANCYEIKPVVVTVDICVTGEGCTLGYWKNHTTKWCSDYTTCTPYSSIFTPSADFVSKYPNLTLLQALNLMGNTDGENLARQSVAALLNACSVNYEYSKAEVIALTNAAWAGDSSLNDVATDLDGYNNQICTLGGRQSTKPYPSSCETAKGKPVKQVSSTDETSVVINSFSVSPVPFRESLSVRYDFDYVSNAVIQIFDLQGRLLLTQNEANASQGKVTDLSINFRILPSQVYVIKVTTDRDVFTKKIISDK